jgi:hypothetical protein
MTTCVRCQSRLDFSDVDFLPPRARGVTAVRRVRWRFRSLLSRVAAQWSAMAARARAALHPDVNWSVLFWSILPGLGHVRRGRTRTGFAFLAIWSLLLVLAAANTGSSAAWLYAGAAVGFHCFVLSLLLAKALSEQPLGRRLQIGLVIYLVLVAFLYGPALLLSRQLFRLLPLNGVRHTEVIANGDVILYSGRWTTPNDFSPGDLVVYRIPAQGSGGVRIEGGWGLDRIVGLPGDRVSSDGSELRVNGMVQPPERSPVGGLSAMPAFELIVDRGEYAILPSTLNWRAQGAGHAVREMTDRMIVAVSRVRQEDLVGKAWWRLRPWDRFGPLP